MHVRRSVAVLLLLGLTLVFASMAAAAREMSLRAVLESLRLQGYDILYSSALVHGDMQVAVESV